MAVTFFFFAILLGMWDLSSPTGTERARSTGGVKSYPLDSQGSPSCYIFKHLKKSKQYVPTHESDRKFNFQQP